jgi:hypothetical protein
VYNIQCLYCKDEFVYNHWINMLLSSNPIWCYIDIWLLLCVYFGL